DRTNIMVGYRQTNQKTDTGKTLTRWPVFVDHFTSKNPLVEVEALWYPTYFGLLAEAYFH
ncbi:hypothetical protein, partial [Klebsiella pneumoniae]|uniref:hypothetical protein n=1 Tax=Klebsiella pneumoniae TaxID=573 RepID=UPI0035BFF624|nr:hypothetical protein [Klebsiella pneumoniae]